MTIELSTSSVKSKEGRVRLFACKGHLSVQIATYNILKTSMFPGDGYLPLRPGMTIDD